MRRSLRALRPSSFYCVATPGVRIAFDWSATTAASATFVQFRGGFSGRGAGELPHPFMHLLAAETPLRGETHGTCWCARYGWPSCPTHAKVALCPLCKESWLSTIFPPACCTGDKSLSTSPSPGPEQKSSPRNGVEALQSVGQRHASTAKQPVELEAHAHGRPPASEPGGAGRPLFVNGTPNMLSGARSTKARPFRLRCAARQARRPWACKVSDGVDADEGVIRNPKNGKFTKSVATIRRPDRLPTQSRGGG